MARNHSCWLSCMFLVGLALISGICAAADKDPAVKELEPVWSLEGEWMGVVGDENEGVVYALSVSRKCVELDSTGKTRREFMLPNAGNSLRLANCPGDGGRALLAFTRWGDDELRAYNLKGEQLWSYDDGQGINDVWPTNLHGDKSSDVIVGFNGNDGLHVLDSKGRLRWKSTANLNPRSVCAGDVLSDGTLQVLTASNDGIRVFGSDGTERKKLDEGHKASTMVRIGSPSENHDTAMIFVDGQTLSADEKQVLRFVTALSGDGNKKWTLELPAFALANVNFALPLRAGPVGANSAMLALGMPWLAIGSNYGQVHVIDAENGKIIVSVNGKGAIPPEVGWVMSKADGKPLLLVANGGKLNAFRVAGTK